MPDNIHAQVSGRVARVFQTRNGEGASVEVHREGSQYPDRVTVWGAEKIGIVEGQQVTVSGLLSWKREVKDDGKTYFNVSLNDPVLVDSAAVKPAQQADAWDSPTPASEQVWH